MHGHERSDSAIVASSTVSLCVPNTPTAMEVWSYVRDEGRPLGVGDQESAPNHRVLLS